MSSRNLLKGGLTAAFGGVALLVILIEIALYVALAIVLFGGAYYILQHFGLLMLVPVA
jgi:sterol desaturase/sphingolipid hydroxylase (fatty acid hydroxylase superfamily)